MTADWFGTVPAHWSVKRLKYSVESVQTGTWGSDPAGSDDDVPCVRVADFDRDLLRTPDVIPTLRAVSPHERASRTLKSGDLLLEKSGGTSNNPVGFVAMFTSDCRDAVCSNFIARLRVGAMQDARYWLYAHAASYTTRLTEKSVKQTTGIQNLDQTSYFNELFPYPPLEEQRRIADFLDAETAQIDRLIAKQTTLIETLRERRTAVVDGCVLSGLDRSAPTRSSGVPWLGDIPAHWTVRPLWSMFERIKDTGHPDEQMLSVFREFGVIPKESRDNLNRTADDRNIYQLVHPGWLATNRMKAWQGSVGVSTHRGIVSGHYICFAPLHDEHHPYLNLLFRSSAYTTGYGLISRGVRVGQAEINNDEYRVLPVVVPPQEEQVAIVQHVQSQTAKIDALIAKAEQFVELSKERRAALITAAVTGQIDLSEAA